MENKGRYAAGIVLYNPDLERLKENLDAVTLQVELVYCFNNGLKDKGEILFLLNSYNNVELIGDGKNLGIATALNKLIEKADVDGIGWVLTLDQDSVVSENMVDVLASLTEQERVAIICPQIEDVRRKNEKPVYVSNTVEDVNFCITSGSFMNVNKIKEIGGFDDYLFIGLVDNEICYKTRLNGYRIIKNNAVVLNHELGNLTPSKHEKMWLKLGTVLRCETIKKLSYKREVSPMRVYYGIRNILYLRKKYKNYIQKAYWNKKFIILTGAISSYFRSGFKVKVLQAICKGISDGYQNSLKLNGN